MKLLWKVGRFWNRLRGDVQVALVMLLLAITLATVFYVGLDANHTEEQVNKNIEACDVVSSVLGYEESKYVFDKCYGLVDGKAVIVL